MKQEFYEEEFEFFFSLEFEAVKGLVDILMDYQLSGDPEPKVFDYLLPVFKQVICHFDEYMTNAIRAIERDIGQIQIIRAGSENHEHFEGSVLAARLFKENNHTENEVIAAESERDEALKQEMDVDDLWKKHMQLVNQIMGLDHDQRVLVHDDLIQIIRKATNLPVDD